MLARLKRSDNERLSKPSKWMAKDQMPNMSKVKDTSRMALALLCHLLATKQLMATLKVNTANNLVAWCILLRMVKCRPMATIPTRLMDSKAKCTNSKLRLVTTRGRCLTRPFPRAMLPQCYGSVQAK